MQKIQHLCDLCYLNGGENAAQHLGIQVGIDRNQMVVDLCDGHKIELEGLLDPYFSAGRRPEIVVAPKATVKKTGGPKPTPAGDFPCKVKGCPRTFTSEQGVSMHLTRVHQIPGVQSAGQAAHDAAIAAASADDVAPPTSGSGSHIVKPLSTRAGMTEEQRERERQRDRERKARKRALLQES